jgi:uncharacterized protein
LLAAKSPPEVCVFLSRRELEVRKVRFAIELPPGDIDFDNAAIRQTSPLKSEGSAEMLNTTLGEIRVTGHLNVGMETECDRCLEPVPVALDTRFDLFYRPTEFESSETDLAIDAGEAEVAFYDGDGIELNEVLREHVLLSLPMQQVCNESCLGICPVCGKNRNVADCHCETKPTDDRWGALRQLQAELKPSNN